MGRRFPIENNTSLLDPFLDFPFSIIGFATSLVVITALCSVRFKRKSSSSPPTTMPDPDSCEETDLNASNSPLEATTTTSEEHQHPRSPEATVLDINTTETQNKSDIKELPLPPALQHLNVVESKTVKRATSERRLSYNVSMKMPRSVSVARNWHHKVENGRGKKKKFKTNESVWMKTIILGGKCVPDEEEDAVIYERKGKKISAYHPRKSTSVSLSKQWSHITSDALSVPQSHEEIVQPNPV